VCYVAAGASFITLQHGIDVWRKLMIVDLDNALSSILPPTISFLFLLVLNLYNKRLCFIFSAIVSWREGGPSFGRDD